jgi:predicted regulator of Ras-like GTPase activity (Roadblock/LC7/MglB family)
MVPAKPLHMPSVPQLLEEDVEQIDAALREFLTRSEATAALLAAEGGFLIVQQGDTSQFDPTTLGALAANAFSATQAIARVLNESGFATVYQQGVQFSILVGQVSRQHMLIVIFPASQSVGAIKYFAAFAIQAIASQLTKAKDRAPGQGFDLAMLNVADSSGFFRMKPA